MTHFDGLHWIRNCGLFSAGSFGALLALTCGAAWLRNGAFPRAAGLEQAVFVAAVMFGIGVGTSWHNGGSLNYFAYATVGIAIAVGGVGGLWIRYTRVASTVLCVCLVGWPVLLTMVAPWSTLREAWPSPWKIKRPLMPRTEEAFRVTSGLHGDVLFDRMPGFAVLQDRRVEVETSALNALRERGFWDPSLLLSDLSRGKWNYVVALNLRPTAGFVFAGDELLDLALRKGYSYVVSLPLDPTGPGLPAAELQIWKAKRL